MVPRNRKENVRRKKAHVENKHVCDSLGGGDDGGDLEVRQEVVNDKGAWCDGNHFELKMHRVQGLTVSCGACTLPGSNQSDKKEFVS